MDPRVGLGAVAGGLGVVAGTFLGFVGGRWVPLPLVVIALSVMLLFNVAGGPLRRPLLVLVAAVLGALSLPLMLNGSGVIFLIGCVFALAAVFYRPPRAGAAVPSWLEDRRHRPRGGDPAPGAGATGAGGSPEA